MKIGIITIQNAINYGSTLQAYALQEVLKEMGHDVCIVNWQNTRLNAIYRKNYNISDILSNIFKGHLRSGLRELKEIMRTKADDLYLPMLKEYDTYARKHLCLGEPIFSYEAEEFQKFDVLICGSDQVWNTEITGGQSIYVLALPKYRGKKIAYAASGYLEGHTDMIDCIKEMDYVSVRETFLQKQLEFYGVNALCKVCDPTLLLTKEFWNCQLGKPIVEERYIFAYLMWDEPIVLSYIEQLANQKKIPAIILHRAAKYVSLGKRKIKTTTPRHFMNLIANAEYVVVNSFHGTVFSILFHKQFVSYGSGERVINLLNDFELSDRLISKDKLLFTKIDDQIDWCVVEEILLKQRKGGREFLIRSLEGKE